MMVRALRRGQAAKQQELAAALDRMVGLVRRVIDPTERRVFQQESVPAEERVVYIFEPHTDVIRKGGRDTHYGHKAFLSVGRAGMVLDLTLEDGNPADSSMVKTLLQRHKGHYGSAPEQASFDAGLTSSDTLAEAQKLGVKDAAFSRRKGVDVMAAVRSTWVYRRLQQPWSRRLRARRRPS